MKKIALAFAVLLLVISACKKNNNNDIAKTLLVGTWNHVNIATKVPTGNYLKLNANGSVESTVVPGYDSYQVNGNLLMFKGSLATSTNSFTVSSDSLYIESITPCPGSSCANLYARQK